MNERIESLLGRHVTVELTAATKTNLEACVDVYDLGGRYGSRLSERQALARVRDSAKAYDWLDEVDGMPSLTPSQKKAVAILIGGFFVHDAFRSDEYDIEVSVSFFSEDDERTRTIFLSLTARYRKPNTLGNLFPAHRNIAIGRRGGVALLNAKDAGRRKPRGFYRALHTPTY